MTLFLHYDESINYCHLSKLHSTKYINQLYYVYSLRNVLIFIQISYNCKSIMESHIFVPDVYHPKQCKQDYSLIYTYPLNLAVSKIEYDHPSQLQMFLNH